MIPSEAASLGARNLHEKKNSRMNQSHPSPTLPFCKIYTHINPFHSFTCELFSKSLSELDLLMLSLKVKGCLFDIWKPNETTHAPKILLGSHHK